MRAYIDVLSLFESNLSKHAYFKFGLFINSSSSLARLFVKRARTSTISSQTQNACKQLVHLTPLHVLFWTGHFMPPFCFNRDSLLEPNLDLLLCVYFTPIMKSKRSLELITLSFCLRIGVTVR